jgi:hypothetical protein
MLEQNDEQSSKVFPRGMKLNLSGIGLTGLNPVENGLTCSLPFLKTQLCRC